MDWDVARAAKFARFAHSGQVDHAGKDYFSAHVGVVWEMVVQAGYNDDYQIVALLHDVIEDWPDGLAGAVIFLRGAGLPAHLVDALIAITHRPGEPREKYYDRVKANEIAAAVKPFDVAQNDDPIRIALIRGEAARDRLIAKYVQAREAFSMPPRDPESYERALMLRRFDERPNKVRF